jgi:hypothetical protein
MNLIEALQEENRKSREFLVELDETEKLLPGDRGLAISRAITSALIRQTEDAIASGDVLQMLAAAKAHGLGEEACL